MNESELLAYYAGPGVLTGVEGFEEQIDALPNGVGSGIAALQKVELLPWCWCGLAAEDGAWERELELIDRLAALSSAADGAALAELRELTSKDARVAVPGERVEATREAELADR